MRTWHYRMLDMKACEIVDERGLVICKMSERPYLNLSNINVIVAAPDMMATLEVIRHLVMTGGDPKKIIEYIDSVLKKSDGS